MNIFLKRFTIMAMCGFLLLTTAQSCSIPGINLFNNSTPSARYGMLKRDPSLIEKGFGFINTIQSGNETIDALQNFSIQDFIALDNSHIYTLTKEKGLFMSDNGGQYWKRVYIFPVNSDDAQTAKSQIARNDAFQTTAMNIVNTQTMYVSGIDSDNIGKIYRSIDGGNSFTLVYSEFEKEIAIQHMVTNPANTAQVTASLSGGALIQSLDNGSSWKKIQSFKEPAVQLEYVSQLNNTLIALFPKNGLFTSTNNGTTWNTIPLYKSKSVIGESLDKNTLTINPLDKNNTFGEFTTLRPVQSEGTNGTLPAYLIADSQAWYSSDVFSVQFAKLPLPVQNEKAQLFDIRPKPSQGTQRIFVAVDSQIIESTDGGQSWIVSDLLNLDPSIVIGNIVSINFDPTNDDIMYLSLAQKTEKKRNSFFGR